MSNEKSFADVKAPQEEGKKKHAEASNIGEGGCNKSAREVKKVTKVGSR
jgi:hypothetical protein